MVGEKFHSLTVIEFIGHKLQASGKKLLYVKCKCDCGTFVEIRKSKVGVTKSCGCIKKNKSFKHRELQEKRFGRLIVIQEDSYVHVGKQKKRRKVWLCKCDCGNQIKVIEMSLLSGNTLSCGCLVADRLRESKFNNLEGRQFGRLLVLKWLRSIPKHQIWHCQCECGELIDVRANNLLTGTTKSCGCLHKERTTKHGLSGDLKAYTQYLRADPIRRMKHRVSCSIRKVLRSNCISKKGSIWSVLPYSPIELKKHLESLFEPWMNWENYGGNLNNSKRTWWIDHVVPQCEFQFTSLDDPLFGECWALSNLQPMEKMQNLLKGRNVFA